MGQWRVDDDKVVLVGPLDHPAILQDSPVPLLSPFKGRRFTGSQRFPNQFLSGIGVQADLRGKKKNRMRVIDYDSLGKGGLCRIQDSRVSFIH